MRLMVKLRITELRKAKGLTLTHLAQEAGIAKSFLSEIERGLKPANTRRLEAIAKVLGVSTPELFVDDGSIPGLTEFIADFCSLPPQFRERMIADAREVREMLEQHDEQKK